MEALAAGLYDEAMRARIEALQWKLAQQLLTFGLTIIIEWGTWARSERDALRQRARELGAAVELHYLDATPEVLIERVRGRERPAIEPEVLTRWLGIFEAPTSEEMDFYDKPAELM
jgi:predicted kinase